MKAVLTLLFAFSLSFACGCGCEKGCAKPGGTVDTLTYALKLMELDDEPDIKLALHGFKSSMRALERGVPVEAFKDGKFDKEAYVKNSYLTQKINAQIDLFETVYLVLNDEQKKQLHLYMAAHQHYLSLLRKESGMGCDKKRACDGKGPLKMKGCDSKTDCDKPMRKRACD